MDPGGFRLGLMSDAPNLDEPCNLVHRRFPHNGSFRLPRTGLHIVPLHDYPIAPPSEESILIVSTTCCRYCPEIGADTQGSTDVKFNFPCDKPLSDKVRNSHTPRSPSATGGSRRTAT